ncbi:hypothetical protein OESDEN_03641 [Oesophagostomum dentatum]|uniref:RNA-directed DNA polymerase n=1 Tax=Oesophagostomum dentatum TaxID=61180 RepID=A0A0B1TJV9_OESDE|nr:hypothetical protein OESDEN_03641 [Oesophagostomum dentatum]
MNQLKKALTTAPILVAPRLGTPFTIETDSSGKGIAGVLKQDQDGESKIIAYASRTLNKQESRYPAIELEALGLVFAVQKFRPYIDGAKCTVITDHAPLKALLHRKDLAGRLAKYQIILQEFDIDIIYRPGKKNIVCDTLSRYLPSTNAITVAETEDLFLDPMMIRNEQDECPWIRNYKIALQDELDIPELCEYILLNNILYKIPTRVYQNPQVVLPEGSELGKQLIAKIHSSQLGAAHLGIKKTHSLVSKIAIWNKMFQDVSNYVSACKLCQMRKDPSMYRINEPMARFEIPKRPWQRVHSDVIGPLPLTLQGNKFVIVFVDSFSKFIVAEPLPDQKAFTTCNTFINRFVARFGPPEILVTDQGSNYMSENFTNTLKVLNIQHRTSTPYHHQTNGQVERANRTIEELISIATKEHSDRWDDVLHLITHAYNSCENIETKHSPHLIIHGQEPNSPFRFALQLPSKTFTSEEDFAEQLIPTLKSVWNHVHQNLLAAQSIQKHQYDLRKRVKHANYQIGQKVLVRKDVGSKIAPRFDGPFEILDIDQPNITIRDGRRTRTVHMNRTKPYNLFPNTTSN